jgi:hypothetical protein
MDARKQDDHDLLCLLKKNSEGEYIWLAPVLFARPDTMVADEFLKNPVLVKVSTHSVMFGDWCTDNSHTRSFRLWKEDTFWEDKGPEG